MSGFNNYSTGVGARRRAEQKNLLGAESLRPSLIVPRLFRRSAVDRTNRFFLHVLRNFLPELRPFSEPAAEHGHEVIVPRSRLCACGLRGRLWQRRRGGQPKANEQGECLDRDTDIAFDARQAPVLLVETFRDGGFASLIGVW